MNIVTLHTDPASAEHADTADKQTAVDAVTPEREGGGPAAPTGSPGHVRRLRESVWAPLLARATLALGGMAALAAVGAVSTLQAPDTELPAQEAALGGVWLPSPRAAPSAKPQAAASAPSATAHHSAPAPSASEASAPGDGGAPKRRSVTGVTTDGKVILNTASADELTRLPGVGPKRAEAIIRLRQRLKRFRRTTDLLRVRGIGVRTLKKMLPHLVLDPPDAPEDSARR